MTFDEYQKLSRRTAVYPDQGNNLVYPVLGLTGEAGEVAEKVKKMIRDADGKLTDERKALLAKELGDVLWYVAQLATELGVSMEDVAKENLEKLMSRMDREQISGDGDER